MKLNLIFGLMLAIPVAAFTACDMDDGDMDTHGGGAGGASSGRAGAAGRAGQGGSTAGNSGDTAGAAGETTSEGGTGGRAEDGEGGTSSAGEGGEAGAAAALTDGQILKALSTANGGEVMAAQVAKPLLQNGAASNYAQMMIDEHGAANEQTLALVATKHLAPAPSDVSKSLEADAAALLTLLSKTPLAAFDKVYIDSQVAAHGEVLSLIDSRLLPDASDADIKALLSTLRTSVAAHLSAAQTISATLP
jgi:putative membrane protein